MKISNNEKLSEQHLDMTSVRIFDTKRTVFIRDGRAQLVNDVNLDREMKAQGLPVFSVGDASDPQSPVNDTKIYRNYPEKGNPQDYTERIIKIAQSLSGSDRKLVVVNNATSYGYVNFNDRFYHPDSIVENAMTFYKPNPIPYMYDHSLYEAKETIGRVFFAQPVYYQIPKSRMNDIRVPKAYIQTYSVLTDQGAIDGVLDLRYLTVSASFKGNGNTTTCSICNANYFEECEHIIGDRYDGKLAYLVLHEMKYNDLSYVPKPADLFAKNLKWELITGDAVNEDGHLKVEALKKAKDEHRTEYLADDFGPASDMSLYLIDDKSPQTVVDLFDMEEKKMTDIFGDDWKCVGDICKLVPIDKDAKEDKKDPNATPEGVANDKIKSEEVMKTKKNNDSDVTNDDNTQDDCGCPDKQQDKDQSKEDAGSGEGTENTDPHEESDMVKNVATLNIIQSLLEDGKLTSTDAIEMLQEQNILLLVDSENIPTENHLTNLIEDCLDRIDPEDYCEDCEENKEGEGEKDKEEKEGEDKKLTTKARKALKSQTFCGPNRSYPVPDRSHAINALARARQHATPALYRRIKSCVCRKAKQNNWNLPACKRGGGDAEGDRVLVPAIRKRLAKSTCCGPGRSWPVPDCDHVRIAKEYLKNPRVTSSYSSSQLDKIRTCVNRKAQALGYNGKKK